MLIGATMRRLLSVASLAGLAVACQPEPAAMGSDQTSAAADPPNAIPQNGSNGVAPGSPHVTDQAAPSQVPAPGQPAPDAPAPRGPAINPVVGACNADLVVESVPAQLLSRTQLKKTLQIHFQTGDISEELLPADTGTERFVVAESQVTSENYVRQLQSTIGQLAASGEVMLDAGLSACSARPAGQQAACAQPWLSAKLREAFRRPPSDQDVATYSAFFAEELEAWGLDVAVRQVLQAMASDPRLLYRIETAAGPANANGLAQVDAHSMAARLSYFVTGAPPDAALSQLADSGGLRTPERLAEEAVRLINSQAGSAFFADFVNQWLGVRFQNVAKSGSLREGTSQEALFAAWTDSYAGLIDGVFNGGSGTIQELLTTETLDLPPAISEFYGDLGPRAGLLTHPGLIAQLSHNESSPVLRGVFIRDHLLCSPLPPPPPNIVPDLPEGDQTNTTREAYALIEKQAACSACHQLIHSLGFAYEEFDALGRYRTQENGFPVDASGSFVGFSDPALVGDFNGVQQMAQRLAASDQLASCVTRSMYEAAIGRRLDALDSCQLQSMSKEFADASAMGGRLRDLVVAVVQSPRFSTTVLGGQ